MSKPKTLPPLPIGRGLIPITSILIEDSRARTVDSTVEKHILELMESIETIGLIQPIVLQSDERTLRSGFCRLQALTRLGYDSIPYTTLADLPLSDQLIVEFEENERRLPMSWQDRVSFLSRIHKQKTIEHAKTNKRWTQKATGKLMNVAAGYVSDILYLAGEISKGNSYLSTAPTITEAIKRANEQKEQEFLEELNKRQADHETSASKVIATPSTSPAPKPRPKSSGPLLEINLTPSVAEPVRDLESIKIPINERLFHGDCVKFMTEVLRPKSIDFILTDIPYGIDTDNLKGSIDNIEQIEEEHDIATFLSQCPLWLDGMYRVLKDDHFCILFYDLDHHEKIQNWAKDVGFKVQRHPLHWIKLHPCSNKVASITWTKSVEHAMVLRKGNATLRDTNMAVNYFSCDGRPTQKLFKHPFVKPFELLSWIIQKVAVRGHVMLDPFAGEGSILRAGILNGLAVYGSELSDHWFPRLQIQFRKAYEDMYRSKVEFV